MIALKFALGSVGILLDRRAGIDTDHAAGAIFRSDLQRIIHPFELLGHRLDIFEIVGRFFDKARVKYFRPDRRMRADQRADVALNTEFRLPDRDIDRDITLLVLGRTGHVRTVIRESRHRQVIAASGDDLGGHRS